MADVTTSPAVAKLLKTANELLVVARYFEAEGRIGEALAFSMLADEYVHDARAMQDMETASKAYDQQRKDAPC